MNAIFIAVILSSGAYMLICDPAAFLPSMLSGTMNAAKCALTLFCIYTVWMGLSEVAAACGLTDRAARLISPVCSRLFKTKDKEAVECISMNLSCNLLGIGGAATPYGIRAVGALEREKNYYAQNLLFIINATSIQLVPTTVITLRAAAGSAAAHDIFLPSLIATIVSTFCAVFIFIMSEKMTARVRRRAKCNI